ncbi:MULTISPECIES: patatin-like phospholipase family protein [Acidiphilium]|uniref:NTE family protein n=1 Tax=Acidiphilium rubrum TaxID=526 RepID=A0A8G2CJD6_ACIRU|nr:MULTISPECIES: patatin-like phospholipase family protein [Acidiphilium]SIQ49483.1 NTE family protein [Acidiphilium rubrum]
MTKRDIGIALSGSGLLLGAHIGALRAVEQAGFSVAEIAGTSGGAIIAASYAIGITPDMLERLYLAADFRALLPLRFYLTAGIRLLLTKGLVSPAPFEAWLRQTLGEVTLGQTRFPCTIVASNLTTERSEIWRSGTTPDIPLWQAVMPSAAFPLVFPPVRLGGSWLQDGGLFDDIPVDQLNQALRLGVVVGGRPTPLVGSPSLIGLLMRDIETLFLANSAHVVDSLPKEGTALAYVEGVGVPIFDTGISLVVRQKLIAAGFEAANNALSTLTAKPT